MLMHDDFLLLFPWMPQVRTMHALPCSDLPSIYNSRQSSCVVVEEMAPLCGTATGVAGVMNHVSRHE